LEEAHREEAYLKTNRRSDRNIQNPVD
jgi:hypothetical protein